MFVLVLYELDKLDEFFSVLVLKEIIIITIITPEIYSFFYRLRRCGLSHTEITEIFSVIPFYFRFFRYKKNPRANHIEIQIWLRLPPPRSTKSIQVLLCSHSFVVSA